MKREFRRMTPVLASSACRMIWAMSRTVATSAVALVLFSFGLEVAGAQTRQATPDDPYKIIGVVWRGETEVEDGFRAQLTQRGVPFEFEVKNLDLDRGNAPPIIDEIRREQPDLVYTWGTGTTTSIVGRVEQENPEDFIRDIPGVFVLVAYPIEANIVESFERPGRMVTGVSFLAPVEVQLGAIKAFHDFQALAVIYDESAGNSRINVEQLREAVPQAGMRLLEYPVPENDAGRPDPDALPELVHRARADGADLLYMGPDSFLTRHSDSYTSNAIEAGLPTFASTQAPLLNSRAMFGLVTDYFTLGRLAAFQAEQILVDGLDPQTLPVGQLARYKLWINMDVAHEVGLYPPLELMAIADFRDSPGTN